MQNSSSSQHLEVNSKIDLVGPEISPYPSPYQRPKSFFLLAYWLGLASVKKVSFSKDGIHFHYKKRQVVIAYQNIISVSIQGFLFKSLKISASKKISVNGLKSLEATEILLRVLASEELAWSTQLSSEANQISQLSKWIDQIQNRTHFQRHSVFNAQMRNAKSLAECFGERLPDVLKETDSAKGLLKIRSFLTSPPLDRRAINIEYIDHEIQRKKDLFDHIENNPLTEEQRKSAVVDEDANLVIASAGSGKTSVIVAKTAWILEKGDRKPSEVLLLAFASAARKEMGERLAGRILRSDIGEVNVHTFHSLGLHVIVRRRMIWNRRSDFGAESSGSSVSGYAA